MNEITISGNRMMTVREVADVLGVTDDAILLHIKELFPQTEITRIGSEHGGKPKIYLNEEQVTAIKQKMRPTTKVVGALTSLDIERMTIQVLEYHRERLSELEAENTSLKARAEADRPKVEMFDRAMASADTLDMRRIAAVLNVKNLGRNKLFALLRRKGVLDGRNVPFRDYQDKGYFRVVESVWTDSYGSDHLSLTTYVYQKGLAFIERIVSDELAAEKKITPFPVGVMA